MSLALWMFNWGTGGAPEPPPVVVSTSAGGGHLDDDYWETRERYIRRMLRTRVIEVPNAPLDEQFESLDALPPQPAGSELLLHDVGAPSYASLALVRALEAQAHAIRLARLARTRAELRRAGARIVATSHAIARLKDQHELENIALMLTLMF